MKRRSLLVAASAITLASGCEQVLPTAPSELTTGIVVYEHANYLGQSAHVTKDIRDLKDIDEGPCVVRHGRERHVNDLSGVERLHFVGAPRGRLASDRLSRSGFQRASARDHLR